jgi:hypothetical protein
MASLRNLRYRNVLNPINSALFLRVLRRPGGPERPEGRGPGKRPLLVSNIALQGGPGRQGKRPPSPSLPARPGRGPGCQAAAPPGGAPWGALLMTAAPEEGAGKGALGRWGHRAAGGKETNNPHGRRSGAPSGRGRSPRHPTGMFSKSPTAVYKEKGAKTTHSQRSKIVEKTSKIAKKAKKRGKNREKRLKIG